MKNSQHTAGAGTGGGAKAIRRLAAMPPGTSEVLQGNLAFALGCFHAGIQAAEGYPGTPSTEVIDRGLRFMQDRIKVGWSVNEAAAVGVAFGLSAAGADVVVTMKVPGLFQAADAVATSACHTALRGAFVLFVATDFVPSSTQYLTCPRAFLRGCGIPILEPGSHQEMYSVADDAATLSRAHHSPVAVVANGILCHSEGLVTLGADRGTREIPADNDFKQFMNLPSIAGRNYSAIMRVRLPEVEAATETMAGNKVEIHSRRHGVITSGLTALHLREVLLHLHPRPSTLSLESTFPLPAELVARFAGEIEGPILVLEDGQRFLQESLAALGIEVTGKELFEPKTEWTPDSVRARLERYMGQPDSTPATEAATEPTARRAALRAPGRPPALCAGCPHRGFGNVVRRLRKKGKISAVFGDIGCYTLLNVMDALDTCLCMGAADSKRQGAVLARPELAGRTVSVIGDSTECHSGLDSTRNAVFRNIPGVKVILDNRTTAMTGNQPAPSSGVNLAGDEVAFDLAAAVRGEGAHTLVLDAFDMAAIEAALLTALDEAATGRFTVLILRGPCVAELPGASTRASLTIDSDLCNQCGRCLICPGLVARDDAPPAFTPACTGCGGENPLCHQMCVLGAIIPRTAAAAPRRSEFTVETSGGGERHHTESLALPKSLRVAIRGVGGQGNLFMGRALCRVARELGMPNVVSGNVLGMAQRGGAVISTVACGEVFSPTLMRESADTLVALEAAEVLRDDFLALAKPGGTVLLSTLELVPEGTRDAYPPRDELVAEIERRGRRPIVLELLEAAHELGDPGARSGNVIALGALSRVAPWCAIAPELFENSLVALSPSQAIAELNKRAFRVGRDLVG